MNAHDRRKASRRHHMDFPLGKAVRVEALLGRTVYAYGLMSCKTTIDGKALVRIGSAKVSRHCGGLIDLKLTSQSGNEQIIQTSMRGLRLVNPEDRAARPWWVDQRRRAR